MLEGFDRRSFERASDAERQVLCGRLAAAISERIQNSNDFSLCVEELVAELRAADHDLWSFDADGGTFEIWCPNYAKPKGPGIVVTFRADGPSEVAWSSR
jgi:hypothetical protein